jgi:hypothetical protein
LFTFPCASFAQNNNAPKKFAAASSHVVQGLSFPVEEIAAVDSKNSRVVIHGKVFLVPISQVDDLVVRQCLSDKSTVQKLPHGSLINFTDKSLENKNFEYAVSGLRAMLMHAAVSKEQWLEFLARNSSSHDLTTALKRVMSEAPVWSQVASSIKIPLLFELGVMDADWIRTSNLASSLLSNREFHDFAERALTETVRTRRFSRLPQMAHFLREIFGVEDTLFHQAKILSEQLERFRHALTTRDASAIEITLLSLQKYQEQRQLLYPYFVEEIHRVVRESIDSGATSQALAMIAMVDLSFRTPTTHALAKLCLERLSGADALILDQPTIKRFLLALAQFDSSLKEIFEKKLVAQFRAALSKHDISQVERVLSMLVSARPDPNLANDQLRIEYAQFLREIGRVAQSQTQLKRVQTGLPFLFRLELFTSDYLGISLFNFIALIISGVLLSSLLVIRFSAFIKEGKNKIEQARPTPTTHFSRAQAESESDNFSTPGFRRMQKTSPERAEYLRCLEVFGLTGEASFKQIRHAYREAVKTHHPDRQGEGRATDKFVDLNQTYERILELRISLGLEDD